MFRILGKGKWVLVYDLLASRQHGVARTEVACYPPKDCRKQTKGGTTIFFEPSGMRECICMYRMLEGTLLPTAVFLHKLGHLLHIRGTGALNQISLSFITYLRRLGAQTDALTIPQLQDVFADTFVLEMMSQHLELEVSIPGLSDQVLRGSDQYIRVFFDEIA